MAAVDGPFRHSDPLTPPHTPIRRDSPTKRILSRIPLLSNPEFTASHLFKPLSETSPSLVEKAKDIESVEILKMTFGYDSVVEEEQPLSEKQLEAIGHAIEETLEKLEKIELKVGELHEIEISQSYGPYIFLAGKAKDGKTKLYYILGKLGGGTFGEVSELIRIDKESINKKIIKRHLSLKEIKGQQNMKKSDQLIQKFIEDSQKKAKEYEKEILNINVTLQTKENLSSERIKEANSRLATLGESVAKLHEGIQRAIDAQHAQTIHDFKISARDLEREYKILREIHDEKKTALTGIQDAPTRFVFLRSAVSGYKGKRYETDYGKHLKLTPIITEEMKFENRLFEFQQLLAGLANLHQKGVLHGDIKPDNILVRSDPSYEGFKVVHLSDFGKARTEKEIKGGTILLDHPFFAYATFHDYERAKTLKAEGKVEAFILQEKKRDVFALGCSFYEAVQGKLPYAGVSDRGNTTADPEMGWRDIRPGHHFKPFESSVPVELQNLIGRMLEPDPEKRISAAEASKALNAFVEAQHPKLHALMSRISGSQT